MTRRTSELMKNEIKRWEGEKLTAYRDTAGILTIGVGHTSDAHLTVTPGLKISKQKSDELLTYDLLEAEQAVERFVKVPLNDTQFGVLVSFVFNLGVGAFYKSTLLKKLNKGDYASVPSELNKWVNSGGRKTPGLVTRRAQEGALWATSISTTKMNAVPEVAEVSPIKMDKETVTTGAAFATTALTAASTNNILAWTVAATVGVGFVSFLVYKFYLAKKLKQ